MNENDEQLVKDYLAGDDAAFEKLLEKYLKPVFGFLYRLTGDAVQAEDLTQITFVKIWKNISKFRQDKSFKTWIFTIAKNTAFDYFKKKKVLLFSDFIDEDGNNKLENIAKDEILPDEILERKDLSEELEMKLKQIPKKYGILLTLCYKEDFSLQEIAKILNLPYNTVKSQHQRALSAIRKVFKKA
ncbi:MAG TPA: hypothetical protein DCS28_00470 [Candidatus Moranbacteria bacterium]|nr:hypothetical protein [Candidatus Moranbacteria bacterium]HAT74504.1 hypothetical protein [Candidatus Moranbacteria bacterium]